MYFLLMTCNGSYTCIPEFGILTQKHPVYTYVFHENAFDLYSIFKYSTTPIQDAGLLDNEFGLMVPEVMFIKEREF